MYQYNYNYYQMNKNQQNIKIPPAATVAPTAPASQTAVKSAATGTNTNINCAANECLTSLPLAMAYVPWQVWKAVWEPEEAMAHGTIFPQLDLPFLCICTGGK